MTATTQVRASVPGPRRRPTGPATTLLCASVAVGALLLGGCGPGRSTSAGTPPPATLAAGAPAATGGANGSATAKTAGLARSVPVSMSIPSINARSSLIQLGLNADQSVQVPPVSTPMQAGWYDQGPTPGEVGPAVLLGHVDGNKQEGIFFRLHELKAGDEIQITRQDHSVVKFRVTKLTKVSKSTFPTVDVYGDTPDAELRVITCGGSFNPAAHSYVDSIIVYATMEGSQAG
jgi:LPXTG-site transpeptidase (sortase) family protein